MKQLTAIFLFVLFLFNLAGYRVLFHYLDTKSGARYEAIIDKELYDDSNLFTIRVDMNMPYQTEQSAFERIDGEITIDGKVYQYVKRRIENGQLVLLCLPNQHKTKLEDAKKKYVEWSNDITTKKSPKENGKNSVQKTQLSDYDFQSQLFLSTPSTTFTSNKVLTDETVPQSCYLNSPAQPPETFLV